MAKEALRNIERHAKATRVTMTLRALAATRLSLVIEGNGIGFDTQAPRPGHYGLDGLREQAELIGADLTIESQAEAGTTVRTCLALSPLSFSPAP